MFGSGQQVVAGGNFTVLVTFRHFFPIASEVASNLFY